MTKVICSMNRLERLTSATGLWLQPHKDATNLRRCELPGAILWQTRLDAGITDLIIADVDGDGQAEIVLSTDDGFVRVLQ